MSVVVTLHIYSGRPDPSWELSDEQAAELAERINSIEKATLLKPPGVMGTLGYSGFSITSVREKKLEPSIYVHKGIVDFARFDMNRISDNPELEEWLLSTAENSLPDEAREHVKTEIGAGGMKSLLANSKNVDLAKLAVPPFNPGKWNNDANIRTRNNCYNYANDKITNTFAQPGLGTGQMYSAFECTNVDSASRRDGQLPVSSASGTPAQGHFIALVMWNGGDYHWYRLDSNGKWSHKPGQTPARNTDNSGALIDDPRTCDRGPYTEFCGFYHCIPANTNII